MGLLESALLTIAIIVIDVLILKEYLKLDEDLHKLKQLNTETPALQQMSEEVNEELQGEATHIIETKIEGKSETERENEKLKAETRVRAEAKKQQHSRELDLLDEKLEAIANLVKSAKQKLTTT